MTDRDIPIDAPEFEGRMPIGIVTKLNGSGQRINTARHLEESVVLLVEAEVSGVSHDLRKDGIVRVQTLGVVDLYELHDSEATELLKTVRARYRKAQDEANGRAPLPLDEDDDGDEDTDEDE